MAGLLVLWARARMREMPDNIPRNRDRGRDAGKGTEERNERGTEEWNGGDAGRAFCCNFDLLPHKCDVTPKSWTDY